MGSNHGPPDYESGFEQSQIVGNDQKRTDIGVFK